MDRAGYKSICLHILPLLIAVIAVFLSIGCCPRHENPFLHSLGLKQFVQRGPTEVYNRDNIFDYMNGEAETYLLLGFRVLYTERYRKPGTGKLILVEVYDMGSSNGAGGVFEAYNRRGGRRMEEIGSAAWTDNSLILFWRSKYFFRIGPDPTAHADTTPDLKDLSELSRNIDHSLRRDTGAGKQCYVSALAILRLMLMDRVSQSGCLSAWNIYPSSPEREN